MANQPREISPEIRQYFDEHVEFVVAELPQQVTEFMERVPLFVEDYPSPQVMRKMRIRHPANLLGLYSGVPLIERSVDQTRMMSDVIHIYRLGILTASRSRAGSINEAELRKQIRKTILHEYGHHVGLDERELRERGYG
jgi:predicted Zn-dependent protease with MMP-like domain